LKPTPRPYSPISPTASGQPIPSTEPSHFFRFPHRCTSPRSWSAVEQIQVI
jgi:hypothetical protein